MSNHAHRRCADVVLAAIDEARATNGVAHVAWCGGASAAAVLDCMADFDLRHTQWYPTDERCVPIADAERNDLLLHGTLVDTGKVDVTDVHPIPAELGPHAGAAAYDEFLATRPAFDVALLSLGPDGHVASLFPGHPALAASGHAVGIDDSPKPPARRVSLSVGRLRAATVRIVVAVGAAKREAARAAIDDAVGPAALVNPTHWILDDMAESR